ncbi:MAG: hypothetical protein K2I30_00015 [Clostridia bacterium]|nr:hypothetical protein [Clostridia bacterium]
MEYKRKECWCCENYRALYSKKLCHFENENCGFCRYGNELITDKHHTCKKWCFNGLRRRIRKEVSLKALNKSLDNLVEIRQILIDEINDNKINSLD